MRTIFSALFRAPAIHMGVWMGLACGFAQAAVTMTYSQEPGGVRVICATGSLRWSGGSLSVSNINGGWNSDWVHGTEPGQYAVWTMLSPNYGLVTGSGSAISAAELSTLPSRAIPKSAGSFSGASNVGIQFDSNGLFYLSVPSGYVEGTALVASNGFFPGTTLADFSLVVGRTITQTWAYAGGTESFTIQAVPEASVAAFCLACCPLLVARRRRSC